MAEKARIAEWVSAAGHRASSGPGEGALAFVLDDRGGPEGRIEIGSGDDPLRFIAPVVLDGGALTSSDLDGVVAQVAMSRGPLVEVRAAQSDPLVAEVSVAIYPDGITRHAVLAALDELVKARHALEAAVASTAQTMALRDLFAGTGRETVETEPLPATSEPGTVQSEAGAAQTEREPEPEPEPEPGTMEAQTEPATVQAEAWKAAFQHDSEPEVTQAESAAQPASPESEAAADQAESEPAQDGRWFYVEAPAEVRDLNATERVIGHLQTGVWHEAVYEQGGWIRARAADGVTEGWVEASCAIYRDAGS